MMKFAILDSNILTALGLKQLLEDVMPMIDIDIFSTFEELQRSEEHHIHFFVASRIYFEHTLWFREQSSRSIVLVAGDMQINGVTTLNVCQSEKALAKTLLTMMSRGHKPATVQSMPHSEKRELLSTREKEVAILLSKGYINKEIADRLNISLTTVITHRKNIMDKLHARSLADIIIHSVMNGLVGVGEL